MHKDMVSAVLGCWPVSSRLISICLTAAPFNITVIQVEAPTNGHDDSEVEHFHQQLQKTIDQTPKKGILFVQGDWNAELGRMHRQTGETFVDLTARSRLMREVETNERGRRLPECAAFSHSVMKNTLGPTNHPEDGYGTAQTVNTTTRLITPWWGIASNQE